MQTLLVRADVRYTRLGVLKAINRMNEQTPAFSVDAIANRMSIGVATVYRHLDALEKNGYLMRKKPMRGCGRKSNIYVITDEGRKILNDDL
jgi:DNA-binding MarR family transcriptional regulator